MANRSGWLRSVRKWRWRRLPISAAPALAALVAFPIVPCMSWVATLEDVGRFNLMQAYVGLLVCVLTLGVDQAYMRHFHEERDPRHLFRVALGVVSTTSALLLLFGLFYSPWIGHSVFSSSERYVGGLVAAYACLHAFARVLVVRARMSLDGAAFLIAQGGPKMLLLVWMVGALAWGGRIEFEVLVSVLAGGTAVAVLLAELKLDARSRALPGTSTAQHSLAPSAMLKYGMPLALSALAFGAMTSIAPLLLHRLSTLREVGLYAMAVSLASPVILIPLMVSAVWVPRVFEWASVSRTSGHIIRTSHLIQDAVLLAFWGVGAMAWIVDLLVPVHYPELAPLIPLAAASTLIYALSEATGVGISISRRTSLMTFGSVAALVVACVTVGGLASDWGARGALIGVVLAHVALLVLRTEFAVRVWLPFRRSPMYVEVGLLLLLSLGTMLAEGSMRTGLQAIWVVGLTVELLKSRSNLLGAMHSLFTEAGRNPETRTRSESPEAS